MVIKQELSSFSCDLIHMGMGISTEAAEILDAIKKHVIYNKPLDVENLVEELGDLEFFVKGLMQTLQLTREEIERHNTDKLLKRYPQTQYSDQSAQLRADKSINS
jgi:NTP pyrophosphatase (non-canonical NTP hydrolase)